MAQSTALNSQSEMAALMAQKQPAVKPKRICVLLAGDNSGQAAQSLRALFSAPEHALELTAVSTVTTLLATLGVVNPEIIVLDVEVAHNSLRETVRRVHRAAPGVPLLVLADEAQKEDAKRALSEGAIDYILREYMDGGTLTRIFRGALERNTFEGLADLLRDHTTGLYTRDGLLTIGGNIMESARRNEGTLALYCVLVQNLAALREEDGNLSTDTVLRELKETLAECFRRSDILARIGDAQFAVLAVDSTVPGASIMRQRLERRLAQLLELWEYPGRLRFSVTGGLWDYTEAISFPDFLDTVEAGLRVGAKGDLVTA
jgi:PleD family two-component response regulator